MTKRTDIDFSNHKLEHIKYGEGKNEVNIHIFKKPDTIINSFKFINAQGIMAVTGDYGNWIFCRQFIPSVNGGEIFMGYFAEKLCNSSTQNPYEYDEKETRIQLNEQIKDLRENNGDSDLIEYYEECLNYCDEDQQTYEQFAYEELPDEYCNEYVIVCKKYKYWFQAVADAFEAICKYMTENEND